MKAVKVIATNKREISVERTGESVGEVYTIESKLDAITLTKDEAKWVANILNKLTSGAI